MKFRTDFVTNSSSSSYISFNIKNSKLIRILKDHGVILKKAFFNGYGGVEENDDYAVRSLQSDVKITMPNGHSVYPASEDSGLSFYFDFDDGITVWLLDAIARSTDSEYLWEEIWGKDWRKNASELDRDITEANIKMWEVFKEYPGQLDTAQINVCGGFRSDLRGRCDDMASEFGEDYYDDEDWDDIYPDSKTDKYIWKDGKWTEIDRLPENCSLEGKNVFVSGKTKDYSKNDIIRDLKTVLHANVTEELTDETDFMIFGAGAGKDIAKALEQGITIITEEEYRSIMVKEQYNFKGKRIAVAGRFYYGLNADDVKEDFEKEGATVTDSVDEDTDILVAGELEKPTKELKKAKELGVRIISDNYQLSNILVVLGYLNADEDGYDDDNSDDYDEEDE